jgi:hypothetical protein
MMALHANGRKYRPRGKAVNRKCAGTRAKRLGGPSDPYASDDPTQLLSTALTFQNLNFASRIRSVETVSELKVAAHTRREAIM